MLPDVTSWTVPDEQIAQVWRAFEDRAETPHIARYIDDPLAILPFVATMQHDGGTEEADRTEDIGVERDSTIYEGLPVEELKAMPVARDEHLDFWSAKASTYRRANYKY